MTEVMDNSSIHAAILNALTAADSVSRALKAVEDAGVHIEDHLGGEVRDLKHGELTAKSFTKQEVGRLRAFAKALEPSIISETQIWFVHDECNMDGGGHQETAISDFGNATARLQTALRHLAGTLLEVIHLQHAGRLLASLR